ncbi:tRNA glutamyl-Q(34) synthetase GluQRS [Williamsia sterculiae]|uniref:tRNA glutamyl-Q(34) synthetase GluQRS n=1 Tax=Williamsia sterculiae TaxID=1344003 RepID=UPI000970CD2A|nr:tRNA glutamyl-Q(34) synthetase GluQRS [Williamsia sterculiae]
MPTDVGVGRYAPSPSGDLHIGNLRTALLAWLFARHTDRGFVLRMEDLDRVAHGAAERQLDDLRALGIDWEPPVVRQSDRRSFYDNTIETLTARGLTYECWCTRREILEAPAAPHTPAGAYPGTCRNLTGAELAERRAGNRPPALRLRSSVQHMTVTDLLHGEYTGAVDDLVLRRNDGTPAYNLVVVVDDAAQGVDQVVRGDDLLSSTPRQAYLAALLDIAVPTYAHVPMALNREGVRLAKRDGAVTLADLAAAGVTAPVAVSVIAESLGLAARGESVTASDLLTRFDPALLPRQPWVFDPSSVRRSVVRPAPG